MADIIIGSVLLGSLCSLAFGFLIYDKCKNDKNKDIKL